MVSAWSLGGGAVDLARVFAIRHAAHWIVDAGPGDQTSQETAITCCSVTGGIVGDVPDVGEVVDLDAKDILRALAA